MIMRSIYILSLISFLLLSCKNHQKNKIEIVNFDELYKTIDLSSNNTYVINFWATWCVPCKEELPDLSLLKSKIKKYNIDVFTISIDKKDIKDQLKFLSNNGASNLDHFFDKEMTIFKALKFRGIPTTIIVDQNSFIISKHEGILKWGEDEVINKIKRLFY